MPMLSITSALRTIDSARRLRGDPKVLPRLQRAGTAHLDDELALPHRVGVKRVAVDGRRGGLEAREADRHGGEHDGRACADDDLPHAFAFLVFGAWDVHMLPLEQRTCHASVRLLTRWF